jgi:hypothetical protein
MPSIEYDLRYLKAGLIDLEGYLLSKELYWPLGATPPKGEPPYSRLTMGGLVMAAHNLQYRNLDPQQQAQVDELKLRLEQQKSKWRLAWEKKATRAFSERLRLWRDFVEDYRSGPNSNADRYPYEVRRRVMLHLLAPETSETPREEVEMLSALDSLLRAVLLPGPFVWETDLMQAYPQTTYWYLYGHLKKG